MGSKAKGPVDSDVDLPLQTVAGEQFTLNDCGGKVILVSFWATWCVPCRTEMPELERYYRDHREDGLALPAVNDWEPAGRIPAYINEGGYTFPVILGGLRAMPTTFVLDRQAEVVYQHVGQLDRTILALEVTPLLNRSCLRVGCY